MKKETLTLIGLFISIIWLHAQAPVLQTFRDTRVINSHSVETVPKGLMDFRVSHRFGDLAGDRGGWSTFYGLENASDISIGLEYGITDQITIGVMRSKGSSALRQLVHGNLKVKLITQKENDTPISLTLLGLSTVSTMQKSENEEVINSFDNLSQRMMHHAQIILGRKFSDRFSLQLSGGFTHRNLVAHNDENDIISVGLATRIKLSEAFGFILDATYPLSSLRTWDRGYYFPLGVGFEIDTGSHVFQLNFTNSRGLVATDYIPSSESNWAQGEFRLGFTISRLFKI